MKEKGAVVSASNALVDKTMNKTKEVEILAADLKKYIPIAKMKTKKRSEPNQNMPRVVEPQGAENFDTYGTDEKIRKRPDPNQISSIVVWRESITQQQLDSIIVKESRLQAEKKKKLITQLRFIVATDYKLNDDKTNRLIDRFTDQIFEQHDTRDEGCQTTDIEASLSQDTCEVLANSFTGILENV